MHESFGGIFPPLATPFVDDEISPEKLKENIQKYNSFDLAGYVVLGTSGESALLSIEESEKLVQAGKEAASEGKKIIVGTGLESTKMTLEFTNRMAGLDVDAALIRTPSYFKSRLNREALKKHFLLLADKSKVPVIIYNNPRVLGVSVDSKLLIELSKHPNIAGIKDSSGDLSFLAETIPHLDPDFSYLVGAGSVLLPGLRLGATGGILAIAGVAPAQCVELYRLHLEGRMDDALRLQFDLAPLNKAVVQTFGIPGLKYSLDMVGYYGGPCRLPLLPLDDESKKEMKAVLSKLGLLTK
jgi:4-hydroxy-2-oxoglutarate aldolase